MSTQCQHGQLARQCLNCEQAAEIERLLREEIERLLREEIEQLLREEIKQLRADMEGMFEYANQDTAAALGDLRAEFAELAAKEE